MFIAAPPLIRALFRLPQPPKRKPISEWFATRLGKGNASTEQKVSN
jgi:hypothetical protein